MQIIELQEGTLALCIRELLRQNRAKLHFPPDNVQSNHLQTQGGSWHACLQQGFLTAWQLFPLVLLSYNSALNTSNCETFQNPDRHPGVESGQEMRSRWFCRYLAESGCVGMCVNLCKTPTQTFFTEELGMPLTMKPNFDDYSCDMIFGERPPSLAVDEVNTQSCYDTCPQGKAGLGKCHKLG